MIPHITKGGDMRGLLGYLASTDSRTDVRANQHEHPRVVGGDPFLSMVYGGQELTGDRERVQGLLRDISAYLERPRETYGVQVKARMWQQSGDGERVAVPDEHGRQAVTDQHVWHCSLSLADGESLTDEQWGRLSTEFADRMGLTGADGHAPARWIAIHHGDGKGGHDHLHVAASMVRQDGTKWSPYRDFPKAQQACRELEVQWGLTRVGGREYGTAARGVAPVERRKAELSGSPRTDRDRLANVIRRSAVASASEAEWIRRVRGEGLVMKPRFAAGTTDVAEGYRVALPREVTNRGRWDFYGGGQLGKDLSLPRIRENWAEPTLEQAGAASAEWQAAAQGRQTGVEGREGSRLGPKSLDAAVTNVGQLADRLGGIPATDRLAWNDAARDLSGVLSAWAKFDPTNAEQLRTAAATLALTAQQRRAGVQRHNTSRMGAATILLAAKAADKPALQASILMAQILKAAEAIRDYHQATGNLRQAQAVARNVVEQLRTVNLAGYKRDLSHLDPEARRAREIADLMNGADPSRAAGTAPIQARPQIGTRDTPGRGRDGYGR